MRCKIPVGDLGQRLDNTVCRYKGLPIHVRAQSGKNQLQLFSLSNGKLVDEIRADDPNLDISSPPLGYVQVTKGIVYYLSRKPARIYKQGLSNDAVLAHPLNRSVKQGIAFNIFQNKSIEQAILGEYPPLYACLKLVKLPTSDGPNTEIAVSREIALKRDADMQIIRVFFKEKEVGLILDRDPLTVITPKNDMGWIISKYLSQLNWKVE